MKKREYYSKGTVIFLLIVFYFTGVFTGIIFGMRWERKIQSDNFITNTRRFNIAKDRFDRNMRLMQNQLDSIYKNRK